MDGVIGTSQERFISGELMNSVGSDRLNADWFLQPALKGAVEAKEHDVLTLRSVYHDYSANMARIKTALRMDDPTLSEEANILAVKKQADAMSKNAGERFDRAKNNAKETLAALDNEIRNRLSLKEGPRSAEIRSHFKSLKQNDRFNQADAAIKAGDMETMAALLDAPIYLSGLTQAQFDNLKRIHIQEHAADLIYRKENIELALHETLLAWTEFNDGLNKLFSKGLMERIETPMAAAAAARAAIASNA